MDEQSHNRWSALLALQVTRLILTGRDSVQRISDKVINMLLCSCWTSHVAQSENGRLPVAITLSNAAHPAF